MVGSRKPFVISPRVLESYHLKKHPAYLHPGVEETILDPTHVNTKLNINKYIYIYIFEICLEIDASCTAT